MPFTFAHPAIVLPLLKARRDRVSATGLIAGSVAPDFEYFFKMSVDSQYSHTIAGIFYFDLPVALFLSVIFHLVAKRQLLANLPSWFRERLFAVTLLDFEAYVRQHPMIFALSAVIGAGSHLFWDSFTHANGFFVTRLWFYEGSYIHYDTVDYPLWYALQHISTAVGLLIISLYIAFMHPAREGKAAPVSFKYWGILFGTAIPVVILRFAFFPADYNLGNLVVTSITGICVGLVVAGLIKK